MARQTIRTRLLLLCCTLVLVSGCAAAAREPTEGPALWSLADADTTIYLFGTVHILRPETQWRLPHIQAALQSADTLYFEADTESPEVQAKLAKLVAQMGLYQDGRTLLTVLSASEIQTVQAASEVLKVPLPALAPLKPWMAGLQLSVTQLLQSGYDPQSGVETVLNSDQSLAGIERGYFETAEQQIRLFDQLSERDQIEMLVAGARFIVEEPDALDALVTAWANGNTEEIGKQLASVDAFGSQTVYDAVLADRNRNWIPQIEALLKVPGTKFVAVGAGHLAGDDSVIVMLERKGYRLRRL